MCQNLKNLTLDRCDVIELGGFTIIHSRLVSLTLKKVSWNTGFVHVDTPQLKNFIFVDKYGRKFSGELTISASDLTYLCIKGTYFPKLSLDESRSLEKVDLRISSPQETDVDKIRDLFQRLHGVKSLALSLEIVELLSTSEEVISHQPSPFPCLKSLMIYPPKGLQDLLVVSLWGYPLESSLDEEQEAMKIKLFPEVTNYLVGSSTNATFTMVSHEETRTIKITIAAYRLMAALRKELERIEAYTDTKRVCGDIEEIYCILLQNIKVLLTKVLASKRVEMQEYFSRLCAKSKTMVNKM